MNLSSRVIDVDLLLIKIIFCQELLDLGIISVNLAFLKYNKNRQYDISSHNIVLTMIKVCLDLPRSLWYVSILLTSSSGVSAIITDTKIDKSTPTTIVV